jgi:hypothetical protein
MKSVAGLFETWRQVDRAVAELGAAGFARRNVSVIAGDPTRAYESAPENGAEVPVGEAGGVGIGGLLGGVIGWLVDAAELAVAEIEVLLASGPLAGAVEVVDPSIVAGAGVGAFAGGLLGAHAGWSFAEARARTYRAGVADGGIMITIGVSDRRMARSGRAILRRAGAVCITAGVAPRQAAEASSAA